MKKIEVFGTGCRTCRETEQAIRAKAAEMRVHIDLVPIHDPVEIATRGILSTPGVMVDGKLVHRGGLPSPQDIADWLA